MALGLKAQPQCDVTDFEGGILQQLLGQQDLLLHDVIPDGFTGFLLELGAEIIVRISRSERQLVDVDTLGRMERDVGTGVDDLGRHAAAGADLHPMYLADKVVKHLVADLRQLGDVLRALRQVDILVAHVEGVLRR